MREVQKPRTVNKFNHDLYNFYIVMYHALKGWKIQSKEKVGGRWEYDLRPVWNFQYMHYRVDPKQIQIRNDFINGADVWFRLKEPRAVWKSLRDPKCVYYKDYSGKEWDWTMYAFDYQKNIVMEKE